MKYEQLTNRQNEVLRHLLRGQTNKEIATDLGLSEISIKKHVAGLCKRLHVKTRTQAVLKYVGDNVEGIERMPQMCSESALILLLRILGRD